MERVERDAEPTIVVRKGLETDVTLGEGGQEKSAS